MSQNSLRIASKNLKKFIVIFHMNIHLHEFFQIFLNNRVLWRKFFVIVCTPLYTCTIYLSNQVFFIVIIHIRYFTRPKTVTHLGALGALVNTLPKVVGILERGIVSTAGLSLYSRSFRKITPRRPFPPDWKSK